MSQELNEAQTALHMHTQKQRSNTVLDQNASIAHIKELESEIDKLRLENSSLASTVEELNMEIMKHNVENGRGPTLNTGMKNSDSFAAEIGAVISTSANTDEASRILKNELQYVDFI